MQAEQSENKRKIRTQNNIGKVKFMIFKKLYIGPAVSAIIFIIGFIMVNNNFGKLSMLGFVGYVLCALSGFALLTTVAAAIVLNGEEKNR